MVQAIFLGNRLLASKANVPLLQRLVSFLELESEDAPLVMPTSFTSFSLPGDEGDRGEGQHTSTSEGGDVAGASSTEGRDSTLRDDGRRIRLTKAVVSTLEVSPPPPPSVIALLTHTRRPRWCVCTRSA